MKSSCDVIHDASNLLDVRPACVVELSVARFARTKTKQLTARGPGSTECTASLRKSAEPAYWPRRVPALGQRCTRAGESGLCRTTAGKCMTRTTPTCPKIRHLILKCPNTHERAQLASRAGTQIPYASSSWRYMGLGKDAGENRNQTIKCRTKIKESNTTCNTTIPYHPEKESKQSKYR